MFILVPIQEKLWNLGLDFINSPKKKVAVFGTNKTSALKRAKSILMEGIERITGIVKLTHTKAELGFWMCNITGIDINEHKKRPFCESSIKVGVEQGWSETYFGYYAVSGPMQIPNIKLSDLNNADDTTLKWEAARYPIIVKLSNRVPKKVRLILEGKQIGDELLSEYRLEEQEDRERLEGKTSEKILEVKSRNTALIRAAKEHYGYICSICGFDFEQTYGERGQEYIHIHHLKPLSEYSGEEKTPIEDLRPVCCNCHVIIHRRAPMISIEEMREILRSN